MTIDTPAKNRPHEGDGDAGSLTAELVVLVPIVVLFALLAIGLGRYQTARQEVADAAHAGASAAAVATAGSAAAGAAEASASASLAGQAHVCPRPDVSTDTSTFAPGGVVRVTVDCQVDLSDLFVPGLPGRASVRITETAPVDPYRMVG